MGSGMSDCCAEKPEQRFMEVGEQGSSTIRSSWRIFTYKELHAATNGFNEDNKLGEGGFGSVYWGKTTDGLQIAVKKLKAMNSKAEMEFAVEVEVLGRVRHKNLLGLRGYCAGGAEQRMIVYDYMPNLSLLSHLHGQFADEVQLHWNRRFNVILGSAEGLLYLHHEVTPHIIHRDIKASNVLLDSEFSPLVADFGFAKLIPEGVSHMTTRVKGTLGYLAPEYAMWGKVSESCDVYSFGILLLEIISGRKPIEKLAGGVKRTITEWAEPLIAASRFADIVDPKLRGEFDPAELRRVLAVAALCVQGDPEKRPNMRNVVSLLKGSGTGGDVFDTAPRQQPHHVEDEDEEFNGDNNDHHRRHHNYNNSTTNNNNKVAPNKVVQTRGHMDAAAESGYYSVFGVMEPPKMKDPYKKMTSGGGGGDSRNMVMRG